MRLAALCVVFFAAACQCGGRCDATTCTGCCDGVEGCLPGTFTRACGKDGLTCRACAPGENCWKGECVYGGVGVGGPGVGGTGGGQAGGSSTSAVGGGSAGGVAGGASGGFVTIPGDINGELGRPCVESPDCLPYREMPLSCLPAPLSPSKRVCQLECRTDGTCGNDGRCLVTPVGAATCRECLVACPVPAGGRSTCSPGERCVSDPLTGRGVCTPDCRLAGAVCLNGVCQASGLCSEGGLVGRCLSY